MFKSLSFLKRFSLIWLCLSIYLIVCLQFTSQNQTSIDEGNVIVNPSVSSYQMENTSFFPHLPIEIHTKNRQKFLQLANRTKKVILLANKFFNDSTWSIKSLQTTSSTNNFSEFYCSILNDFCEITTDLGRFSDADAVLYHLRDPIDRSESFVKFRRPSQRFVFALWETPRNTPDLHSYKRFFNWTMTYRFDSHIFSPYYLSNSYRSKTNQFFDKNLSDWRKNEEIFVSYENIPVNRKKGTAAALISNCGEKSQERWELIKQLEKYIDVTIYGQCGKPCPSSVDCRDYIAENYFFFLTFENSFCRDYITEKFFSTILLPIVPVVLGETEYARFIPPSGFIDLRKYSSFETFANDLRRIQSNLTLYQSYFQWKKDFIWGGLSTYMSSFCDLCLRLHLDTDRSVVDNIQNWWHNRACQ